MKICDQIFEKEAKFGQIYTHESEDDICFTCLKSS